MSSTQADVLAIVRSFGGDPLDLPFWEACRDGRFLLHRCDICKRHYWPASRCIDHGGKAMQWVTASGRGTLYTYTIMHHAYTSSMKGKIPYVVAVVKLEEGPFFHSNLVDCSPDEVAIGLSLKAVMREHETGLVVPMFQPTSD
jgi:uncharacterized protein